MTNDQIMFYLFAAIISICSVMTVVSRRILRAAVFLLFVLIATAGMYFMLEYFFLAGVQLMLYAGGIVVLIIFSILLTSHINQKFQLPSWRKVVPTIAAVALGLFLCITTILHYTFKPSAGMEQAKHNLHDIGLKLLDTGANGYALPFEAISILLLAAMIAASVIAKKN